MKKLSELKFSHLSGVIQRALCALATFLVVFALLIAGVTPDQYDIHVGQPASKSIYATKDVEDSVTTQALREAAANAVEPSYKSADMSVNSTVLTAIERTFSALTSLRSEYQDANPDDVLQTFNSRSPVTLTRDMLSALLSCEIAKEVYKTWKEKYHDLNCRILGGCRATWHYTEMVPGDMSVTVNYDFIEELNALNPEIESRIDVRESDAVVNELKEKLPAFAFSISQDSRIYQHWSLVPTALYFRNYVRAGWNTAAATVRERRLMFR